MNTRAKILAVDDEPLFLELEELFLAELGQVFTASSGRQTLEVARRERPDVVLLDMNLPDMDGAELCRALKTDRELSHTSVVAVTDGEIPNDRARAVQMGAEDVLTKPLNRISLIQCVRRLLRQDRAEGLPRVAIDTPVEIRNEAGSAPGRLRNLSRGGVYVETPGHFADDATLTLGFELPHSTTMQRGPTYLRPSARVVWHRVVAGLGCTGIGLQFLEVDSISTRRIEEFIAERNSARVRGLPSDGVADDAQGILAR